MFQYQATVVNVVDGDTLDVTIDLGFRMTTTQRVRLYGLDTPERGQPNHDKAAAMLAGLVGGQTVTARSIKPADKYGRWLASLSTPTCPDVAQAIIDVDGFAG